MVRRWEMMPMSANRLAELERDYGKYVLYADYAACDARIRELETENARLNMEMAAYRQGCTPKDATQDRGGEHG